MRSPDPFRYPCQPHRRRHGPRGYADHGEFRAWLRDEFDFRCVYCLFRERWGQVKGTFHIDHFEARKLREDLSLVYDNLVYSCHTCNLGKSTATLPDPHAYAYGECLRVEDDGTIKPLNKVGETLIDELTLDDEHRQEFRKTMLDTIKMASDGGRIDILRRWLGLPSDLPNLERCEPPEGNERPEGLNESWYARGERPDVFE